MPCALPGEQHLAIFRDLVLTFLGHRKIVGIDVLQSDEHPGYACSFGLRDEARDFVAKRIDLDHQTDWDAINLAKLDEAVEDRLPVPVAGKIIVGDEELVDPLRPIEAQQVFNVIGRTMARRAALHVDDRAKRALVRAPTSGVKTSAQSERTRHKPFWKEGCGRTLKRRKIIYEVVNWREFANGRIA